MNSRRMLLIASALTLLLVGWVAWQDNADDPSDTTLAVRPAVRDAAAVLRPGAAMPPTDLAAALSAAWAAAPASAVRGEWSPPTPQALAAWTPPAPPPPPAVPVPIRAAVTSPPVPQAPPLPYTLIGRFEDQGQVMALISGPTGALGAKAGDVLDGQWRVDAVQPNAVTFTWLPANVSQTLAYKPS